MITENRNLGRLQEVFHNAGLNHYGPHVPVELVRMVGSHSAAHAFSYLAHWSAEYEKEGIKFYKTNDELAHSVAISKTQLKIIRKKLEPFGLRSSRKGNSALYYWIDWDAFKQAAAKHAQERKGASHA